LRVEAAGRAATFCAGVAKGSLVSTMVIPWVVSCEREWAALAHLIAASLITASNVLVVLTMDLISADRWEITMR